MRPTADSAKKAQGTFTPARSRPPMRIPRGCPKAPESLSERAVWVWNGVVPDLKASGVLAKVDFMELAILCELYAEWESAPREMSAGKIKEIRMLCAEFGMSISSRLKLKAPEGAEDPEEPCEPKSEGNVVSIAGLRSSTRRMS